MSPGLDAWREQSRSPSPKSGSRRSRRSRSRSPSHGFMREGEGWNDRSRSGTVGSTESRGSRHDRGRYSGHSNTEHFNDSRDKISHGYGSHYDGDRKKHELHRNNRSIPRCNDFSRGKCYRGSSCKFVHHGGSADGWPRERERSHDRRGTDVSYGLDQRRAPRRSSDTPCKFFAVGRCRNGDSCRFSHHGQVDGGPEESSCDDKVGHSLNNENISWGGSKWSDEAAMDDATKSSHCVTGNSGSREGVPDSKLTENFTNSSGGDTQTFSHCMDREQPGQNTQDLKSLNHQDDINFHILPTFDQNMNHYALPQQQHISPAVMQQIVPENVYIQQQPSLNPCKEGNTVGDSTKSHKDENFFANNLPPSGSVPGQSFNQNGQSQHMLPQPPPSVQGFNLNGHDQQMVPLLQLNGQSFNLNGHSQQTSHPQLLLDQEESVKNSDMLDMQMSPITSGTPVSQNMITSEQVAQIAQIPNLSASLAQIFGNEQITQLYATLNNGLVPSLPDSTKPPAPTGTSFIQPDLGSWSHKPCEPEINNHPPGFSSNLVEPKNNFIEESETHLKSMGPLSVTSDANDGNPFKYGGLKEKQHQGNEEFKQQVEASADNEAKERNEVAIGQSKKEEQTGHLEDTNVDDRVNEESKRGKDPKGMRMFKFALVELVKEILKPAWKEGHISKEAHNTIVKKVVAKVTGTIQGPQIPQTQEKIDHYLSHSKPKLTKLVQAYVEKHSTT
eukprot:TRINITY_DN650_c0_g3_i1.p1 TRINITY_DN650_c0_g3~~TRINITY_DN650_c0_g3_i1.p1  ORF type:complete len:767 (-),score=148.36 TRINITY_DN650_c0_g3_i1:237-2417(-)